MESAQSAAQAPDDGQSRLSQGTAAAGSGSAAVVAVDAYRRLLSGSGTGQMNLAAVRARGQDLRRTLDELIFTLQHHPDRVQWAEALHLFAVISVQLATLSEQLRPLGRLYAAHPRAVSASNAAALPIMLATRALPEMEAEQAALLAAHRAAAGAAPLGAQYEATGVQMEHVNAVVDALMVHAADKPGSGALDPKGPVRKELAQQLRAGLAGPPKRPAAGRDVRGAKRGPGSALLAAVARGEGLTA